MSYGNSTNLYGLRKLFAGARGKGRIWDKFFFLIAGDFNCTTATHIVLSVRIWRLGVRLYWCPTCVSRTEINPRAVGVWSEVIPLGAQADNGCVDLSSQILSQGRNRIWWGRTFGIWMLTDYWHDDKMGLLTQLFQLARVIACEARKRRQ